MITTVGETSEASNSAGDGAGLGATAGIDGHGNAGNVGVEDAGRGGAAGAPPVAVPAGDGKCVFDNLDAERHPLEMYILMDSNVTLAAGLWELAVDGLRRFSNDPRSVGIHVGVRYYGSACDADTYAMPNVAVEPLPDNVSEIAATTMNINSATMTFQASEMWPALRGGIAFESARAKTLPDMKHIVVLISDGFTTDLNLACPPYVPEDVIAAASAGMALSPPIETHVVVLNAAPLGFPVSMLYDRFQKLREVAAAGGTASIDVGSTDVPMHTNEALQTVRRRAQPCDYVLPPGADTPKVSLALVSSSSTVELPRTADANGCGNTDGWHFDDPAQPTRMQLCPHSCSLLRADDRYSIAPLKGCKPTTR